MHAVHPTCLGPYLLSHVLPWQVDALPGSWQDPRHCSPSMASNRYMRYGRNFGASRSQLPSACCTK
jgi:hypothetical protein